MKMFSAALGSLALAMFLPFGAMAAPSTYEFAQDGFDDGGTFSGFFEAEDLDGNSQISSFTGEVFSLEAAYNSAFINTTFSLDDPEGFFVGLVFDLDGFGTIGDGQLGDVEGLAIENSEFSYATGPGPFQLCDGQSICGEIFRLGSGNGSPVGDLSNGGPTLAAAVAVPSSAVTSRVIQVTSGDLGELGQAEDNPFLPSGMDEDGGFVFRLPPGIQPGETFFIDPDVAVGYSYDITGSTFATVTAPTFGAVPDPDGYTVTSGATSISLASGATYTFGPGVTSFEITGIDASLALDPDDPLAFVTGVSVGTITGSVTITQTPITAPVPLPMSSVALGSALLGLFALRRRRTLAV